MRTLIPILIAGVIGAWIGAMGMKTHCDVVLNTEKLLARHREDQLEYEAHWNMTNLKYAYFQLDALIQGSEPSEELLRWMKDMRTLLAEDPQPDEDSDH